MLDRLARFATAHARQVLLVALFVVIAAGVYGSSAVSRLSTGGFTDSSSPSTRADFLLCQRFHHGDPNLVFLVEAPAGADSSGADRPGSAWSASWLVNPT